MDISLTYVLLICKTKTFYLENCMSYLCTPKRHVYVKNEPNRAKSRVNMYRLWKIFVWFDMILTIKHHSRSLHTLWPQTPCKKSIARSDQLTRRYTCTLDNGFFLTSTLRFNVKCEGQSSKYHLFYM